jgi:ribosomal protein S12 methylthiotransferase
LVDGVADQSISARGLELVGRTFRDAPEVDGFVLFRGRAQRGDLVSVRITAAGPYDLFGEQVDLPGAAPSGLPDVGSQRPAKTIGLRSLPVLQPR